MQEGGALQFHITIAVLIISRLRATDSVQPYVNRKFDNFDNIFTYSENGWEHSTMDSFKNYKRTISHGTEGDYFTVDFEGTGIILTGAQKGDTVAKH